MLAAAAALNVSGSIGTFAVNPLRTPNTEMTHFLSPLGIVFHYGTVSPDGRWLILVRFDYRIIDTRPLLAPMGGVDHELNGFVVGEFRSMANGNHPHTC